MPDYGQKSKFTRAEIDAALEKAMTLIPDDPDTPDTPDTPGILVNASGVNLLDNWYFADPINQRGQTEYLEAGYAIDRWKLESGALTRTANGIVLNGTLVQLRESAIGQDCIASALTTAGIVSASYDDETKKITLTGVGETFVAAKLELGTQQTLAHQDENGNWVLNDPPPNRQQELAKCQRYFVNLNPFKTTWTAYGLAVAGTQTEAYGLISLPVPMRVNPTVVWSGSGTLYLSQSKDYPIVSVVVSDGTISTVGVQLGFVVSSGLTANSLYRVQGANNNGNYIWLDANL